MTNPEQEVQHSHTRAPDLGTSVEGLVNALTRGVVREAGPHGLSPTEYNLLRICMEMGECTATDLARVLPIDASRISRIVSRLVDMELLVRRRLRSDRRIVMLQLSPEGKELTSALYGRIREYEAKLTDGISEEEMRTLESITAKILANHAALEP